LQLIRDSLSACGASDGAADPIVRTGDRLIARLAFVDARLLLIFGSSKLRSFRHSERTVTQCPVLGRGNSMRLE